MHDLYEFRRKKKNSGSGVLFLKLGDDFGCSLKPLNRDELINWILDPAMSRATFETHLIRKMNYCKWEDSKYKAFMMDHNLICVISHIRGQKKRKIFSYLCMYACVVSMPFLTEKIYQYYYFYVPKNKNKMMWVTVLITCTCSTNNITLRIPDK